MKIYVLFIHRKENYVGQHAPEAVGIMDEWGMEENADYLFRKKREYEEYSDVISARIVCVTGLNQDRIRKLLLEEQVPVEEATGMEVVD